LPISHRSRREAGGGLRPQGLHAPGRRGPPSDRGRLPERRDRPFRQVPRCGDAAERSCVGARERFGGIVEALRSPAEIERRYRLVRQAMDEHGLDAVVVAGSEYTGFEGAVTYLSGFVIVHRYAYVLLPRDGEPSIVFPAEARYVGEHATSWIEDQVFADRPGEWLAERLAGNRVGVYGLDYVLTVRDFVALRDKAAVP